MNTTQTKDIRMAEGEQHVHGAQINGTCYVIAKKLLDESEQKEFTLYEYTPALTLKSQKAALKPLYSDSHFGKTCYEMFRRGLGLNQEP